MLCLVANKLRIQPGVARSRSYQDVGLKKTFAEFLPAGCSSEARSSRLSREVFFDLLDGIQLQGVHITPPLRHRQVGRHWQGKQLIHPTIFASKLPQVPTGLSKYRFLAHRVGLGNRFVSNLERYPQSPETPRGRCALQAPASQVSQVWLRLYIQPDAV